MEERARRSSIEDDLERGKAQMDQSERAGSDVSFRVVRLGRKEYPRPIQIYILQTISQHVRTRVKRHDLSLS